jgi:hypothetical protein
MLVVVCSFVRLFVCSMDVGGAPTLVGYASAASEQPRFSALGSVGAYSYTRLQDWPDAPAGRLYLRVILTPDS